ncbi:MAG: hypothetical protein EXQ92_05105 [Alphaproteobacteria bacterium]|nr:hypothetical protein [Alphaproteobacteria bacterium]
MPAYSGLSYTVTGGGATFTAGGRAFTVDDTAYQNMNLDVKGAVAAGTISSGFAHWLSGGWAEGRSIGINGSNFVESAYLSRYPDVAAATTMGLESGFHHWIDNGAAEGRTTAGYLTQQGASGNDTLVASAAIVRGYEGDDSIVSGGTAFGGTGNDTISGGDLIYGNQGDDSISDGGTAMFGGQGNDTVSGSYLRNDLIYGNMGDDALSGGVSPSGSWRCDFGQ